MTTTQLLLTGPTRADEIEAQARRFDHEHPEVYHALIALAREEHAAGIEHGSIGRLFEVVRRDRLIRTSGAQDYALNHNHRAYYARRIMSNCNDLDGFFAIRERRSEHHLPMGERA